MQQARVEEGLVLAGADLGAHQLRAGRQDTGVLLVEVDPGHGRHVVDVVVISEHRGGHGVLQETDTQVARRDHYTSYGPDGG